ncbi:MAG: DNA repair protein RecO, partial [Pseudomonadota bacterium]|nr:DNA repair protein RecO [Pseudomonadota bacterium]
LSTRKHGENSAIARLFARGHGVFAGVIKGAHSKTNRGVIQPGNIVNAAWQARLAEHIGTFKCELLEAGAAHLMQDAMRLSALTSLCALIESSLPERHPYPKLYEAFKAFLATLKSSDDWLEDYVKLELSLLAEAGFGLDLSRCAATGTTDDLVYVSPKSGRAVSSDAGEPYKEKLLALPAFFLPHNKKNRAEPAEILAGMQLTGYFLDHWLLSPHHRKLPAARGRLVENIKEEYGAEA